MLLIELNAMFGVGQRQGMGERVLMAE